MKALLGFIGIIIFLWFIWFITGGPRIYETEDNGGKFLEPPPPLGSGQSYN